LGDLDDQVRPDLAALWATRAVAGAVCVGSARRLLSRRSAWADQRGITGPAGTQVPEAGVLSQAELDAIVDAATVRLRAAGLTTEQVAHLRSLRSEVDALADLPLGEAVGDLINVHRTAAGNSWFVDPNPSSDAEFSSHDSATRRYTDPAGASAGRMDLLTAVMHEMGHALGLEDAYHESDRDLLMYGFLTKGERRLPAARDTAFQGGVQ
jgi:hypothetical protein